MSMIIMVIMVIITLLKMSMTPGTKMRFSLSSSNFLTFLTVNGFKPYDCHC